MRKGPVGLIILDGWGLRSETEGNAVAQAQKPHFDQLWQQFPHTSLATSGEDVGLPTGQMGNSEVGHMNLGAGRIVLQDLLRIQRSIHTKEFLQNPILINEFEKIAQSPNSTLHLLGLVSDGGIHSHLEHLMASVKLAKNVGIQNAFIHAFTDGRDTSPTSGIPFIKQLETYLSELQYGKIATVCGRFWAMDRDQRWPRIEKAFQALVEGKGRFFASAQEALQTSYDQDETDEFITPSVIVTAEQKPLASLSSGDGLFYFNFRPDRCREMVQALSDPSFKEFSRPQSMKWAALITMTQYHQDYSFPVAFPPFDLSLTLGEILALEKRSQLRSAETEKFPHVTYFFNGGRNDPFPREERILIPSPREVKTYDEKPEMSAPEVTDAVVQALQKKSFDFFLLNYANPDMVGHTGDLQAAITAVETIDQCLHRVVEEVLHQKGACLITADHGNCEQMIEKDGSPHTAHTTNRVPLILADAQHKNRQLRANGILADVAPTLIHLLNLQESKTFQKAKALMNGQSLLK